MKSIFALFGIVVGLGLAAVWFYVMGPGRVPLVDVTRPERGAAVEAVYATGTVESSVMLPIAPRMAGRLVELSVDEGQEVVKGQVLARLEDSDLQKNLEELRARAVFARKDFERKSELVKKGYGTKSSLDQARSELDALRANIEHVEAEQSYMKLLAPANGKIIRRDGEIGQMLPVNEPVFWMSCCSDLRISAEVDEEDIARVAPGQKVLVRADAFPGEVYNGKVQSITPKGDPVSRSYRVRISLEGIAPLQIGMTAESNIIVSEKPDALLLTNSAIDGGHVWVVIDGVLHERAVVLGLRGADKTEITSGLGENDSVVAVYDKALIEGRPVRVRGGG